MKRRLWKKAAVLVLAACMSLTAMPTFAVEDELVGIDVGDEALTENSETFFEEDTVVPEDTQDEDSSDASLEDHDADDDFDVEDLFEKESEAATEGELPDGMEAVTESEQLDDMEAVTESEQLSDKETVTESEQLDDIETVTESELKDDSEFEEDSVDDLADEAEMVLRAQGDTVMSGTCGENVTWTLDSEGTLIISGTGPMEGYMESTRSPFYNRQDIKTVIIASGVTNIGSGIFLDCKSMTNIVIQDGVRWIEYKAFKGCSSLTNITIPDSVTDISNEVFSECSSLTSITIPDSVTSIGEDAFYNCSSLTSITIPDSVTSIGRSAFFRCSSLTSITIPDSVTSIAGNTFNGCSSLTSITIPDSVTSIDAYAFKGCSKLTSITIPYGQTEIGMGTFDGCSSLTSITIPDSVTSIGYHAFFNCSSMTSITIPDSVTSIGGDSVTGGYAFSNCSSMTSITIPDSVSFIAKGTFKGCSSLTNITIPDSVTSIWNSTFEGCSNLTNITIPDSVTSIDSFAFKGCSSLTNITIPDSVTSIGVSAFESCSSLRSITIPDSVTSIGNGISWPCTFKNCSSLTSIIIPDSVTSIGGYTFYGCSNLKNITIPDSVTSIGECAFYNCSSLTSIAIPDSVTSIAYYAFFNCSSLTSIAISDSVTSIWISTFEGCSSLTSITIPDSVTSIDQKAFYNCSSLTSITIPDSVTSIGSSAFSGCSKIEDVFYTGSKEDWGKISIESCNSYLTSATIYYNYVDYEGAINSGEGRLFAGKITEVTADSTLTVPWYCLANGRQFQFSKEEYVTTAQTCLANDSYFISTIVDNVICEISEVPKAKFDLFGYCEENGDTSVTIDGTQYELCPMILHNRDVVQTALYKDQFVWFSLTADNKIAEIGITNSFEGELSNYNASAGTVKIKNSGGNGTYIINYAYMPEEALTFMSTMAEGSKANVVTCQRTNWASNDFDPEHEGAPADYYLDPEVYLILTDGVNVRNADFEFTFYQGTLELVKYLGNSSEVIIQEKQRLSNIPGKYTIVKILDEAFKGCESVTKIVIPDSVESVADYAFENCINLRELQLGTGMWSFSPASCAGCNSLTRITIPYSVTSFETDTFPNADQITICGEEGSEAYVYAKEHHIKFEAIQGRYYSQAYKPSRDAFKFKNVKIPEIPYTIWTKVFSDNLKNLILYNQHKKASSAGICYGMASVSGLLFNNRDFIRQWGNYSYIREIPPNASAGGTSLEDFLLQNNILQWTPAAQEEWHRNYDNYEGLIRAVTNFERNQTDPVVISIWNNEMNKQHTVFPYSVETIGDAIRIYVYNPNLPFKPGSRDAVNNMDHGEEYIAIEKEGNDYRYRYEGGTTTVYDKHFTFEHCFQEGTSDSIYSLLMAGADDALFVRLNGNNVNVLAEGNQFDENGNVIALPITGESGESGEPGGTDNAEHLLAYLNPDRSFRLQKNADPDEMTETTYVFDDKELDIMADGKAVIDLSGANGLFSAGVTPGSSDKNVAFTFDNEGDVLQVSGSTDSAGRIQEQSNGDVVLSGFHEAAISFTEETDSGTVTEKLNLTEELNGNAVLIDKRENGDIALKEDPDGDGIFNKNLTYIAVTGVSISSNTLSMEEKTKHTLSAVTVPEDASEPGINWSSSNPDVANVDKNGTVTAVAPGKAVITATTVEGGFTASCTVTVTASKTDPTIDHAPGSAAVTVTASKTDPTIDHAPGSAAVTVTASKTDPTIDHAPGSAEKITIFKKPTIQKPAQAKGKITVKWKHFKQTKKTKSIWKKIKNVQVQCATDKSFKNIVKTTLVGKKKTKATIKRLAKKTTYYVRVRYYDGTGYSAWSKVKKVKTK